MTANALPFPASPALSDDSLSARERLVSLAARYHAAGWMLGTSGNLSVRLGHSDHDERVVVTASGCDKGDLAVEDFVEVDLSGRVLAAGPGRRPSAETAIHLAVYARAPEVGSVLHVHTPASTVALPSSSAGGAAGAVAGAAAGPEVATLRGLEMLKGWGLWQDDAAADLPFFRNHADVGEIACEVALWLALPRSEDAPAVAPAAVVRGHGITAWGASVDDAHRHVEVTEFFCRLLAR